VRTEIERNKPQMASKGLKRYKNWVRSAFRRVSSICCSTNVDSSSFGTKKRLRWWGTLRKIPLGMGHWLVAIVVSIWNWVVDYDGFVVLALLLKGLSVGLIALVVCSPAIVFTWILNVSVSVGEPLCYVLYIVWWMYLGLLLLGGGLVGYAMETKSSSWMLPKSFDYQRQKTNK